MSKRMTKNNVSGRASTSSIISSGYVCVGSYEDKPKNKIYYFVHNNSSRNFDCILEYDLFKDNVVTVYKDGRQPSSHGNSNWVLNFNDRHLITGINKIDDILYWTDGLNRPRKINVELAKQNEVNISNSNDNSGGLTRYSDIVHYSSVSSVFIGVSSSHNFEVGDEIYTQLDHISTLNAETSGFNGYCQVTGLIPVVNDGITFSATNGNPTVTASDSDFGNFNAGDYISIQTASNFPYFYEIDSISGATITLTSNFNQDNISTANPLQFNGTNVGAIKTDCPWAGSFSSTGGLILYAEPEGAYSPLISFGSSSIKEKYLDVVKHQPLNKPLIEGGKDPSVLTNNIMDGMFQFKYRYKHFDEELTSYSPISDLDIDTAFAKNSPLNAKNYAEIFNLLRVSYEDSISDVTDIEIVTRKGNLGEFILVDSIPNNFTKYLKRHKNTLIQGDFEAYEFTEDEIESTIVFKNNGVYPYIDRADSQKLYDSVPKRAKAQTILSNNRIAYGNILEGYDNTKIAVNGEFTTDDMPQLTSGTQSVGLRFNQMTSGSDGNGMLGNNGPDAGEHPMGGNGNGNGAEHSPEWELSGLDLNSDINQTFVLSYAFNIQHNPDVGETLNRGGSINFSMDASGFGNIDQLGNALSVHINNGAPIVTTMGSGANNIQDYSATYSTSTKRLRVHFQFGNNDAAVAYGTFNLTNSGCNVDNQTYLASGDVGVSTFKTGAHHDFGISYFDETNRCSFVNLGPNYGNVDNGAPSDVDSEDLLGIQVGGSRIYNRFWTEGNIDLGRVNKVNFQIYNQPPDWATHYQFCYAGNTSVDEFIQMSIANAKKATEADNTQVYLSLQSLKGEDVSYNENTPSKIDYDFVKGDRIRFISCEHNGSRKKFNEYIDLEIAGEDLFTSDFEAPFSVSSEANSGWYIRIVDPANTAVELEDGSSVSIAYSAVDSDLSGTGFHKLIAEIYRPKQDLDSDLATYYEVGPKREIISPGTNARAHSGDSNQSGGYHKSKDIGIKVSQIPAVVNIYSGDVYLKPRSMNANPSGSDTTIFFPESYYLNDFHTTNSWNRGRINVVNNRSAERHLEASVYYSEAYSSTGATNGLSSFNLANAPYFDYNKDFGSIQALKMKDNDLIVFHEDKVGRVLVEKDILTTATGEGSVSLSTNIISNYVSLYSGEYGCALNPESIASFGNKFYFSDVKRGVVLRLSNDGLTVISDEGMRDYFRDFGELYVNSLGDNYITSKVLGGYDPKYDEYIITLPKVELKRSSGTWDEDPTPWDAAFGWDTYSSTVLFEASTLAFNERVNRWTSFYSFIPEFYGKVARQFVTFKGGKIYKHNVSDKYARRGEYFNRFYTDAYPSELQFPFNIEPSSVKAYNAISLEGDVKLETSMYTNTGRYHSNYSDNNTSTNIGYRKVEGLIKNYAGLSDSVMIEGVGTEFYKDLKPGDPIRIYGKRTVWDGDVQVVENTYVNRIVRTINSNTLISINTSIDLHIDKDRLEVIDYKTKENVHYSDLPFIASEAAVQDANDYTFDNSGDGSEFIGLGMGTITNVVPGNSGAYTNTTISIPHNLEGPPSIHAINTVVGARYFFTFSQEPTNLNLSDYTTLNSVQQYVPTTVLREIPSSTLLAKSAEDAVYFLGSDGTSTLIGYVFTTSIDGDSINCVIEYQHGIQNGSYGFFFIAKTGSVEGEKMKGNYMMTTLKANDYQSKYKFNLYAANADIDKSELSNK